MTRCSGLLLAGVAALLLALQIGLPSETFFVGDQGVKLVVVRHAIQAPAQPLELPLPRIGKVPVTFVEPFYIVHGDHLHAETSVLFPLLTAPLVAWLGMRGAYVLPGLGFLGALAAWTWMATSLDARRMACLTTLVLAVGAPWLFYGLEFWEHAPALALAGAGAALFVRAVVRSTSQSVAQACVAGCLLGCSILLRPEAVCFALALMVASPFLKGDRRARMVLATLLGVTLVLGLLALWDLHHFGRLADPHVSANLAWGRPDWRATRGACIREWFLSASRESAWSAAPLTLLAFVPSPAASRFDGRRFLMIVAAVFVTAVVLTAPNDGGGQRGPRYLLIGYGPIMILAADSLQALGRRGVAGVLLVALMLAGGAYVQRRSYLSLRGAKRTYGRMLAFVRQQVPIHESIVTNAWWLDQVAAAATADRQFLYAPDTATLARILHLVDEAHVPGVTLMWSAEESAGMAFPADGNRCYASGVQASIPERELTSVRLTRTCSP